MAEFEAATKLSNPGINVRLCRGAVKPSSASVWLFVAGLDWAALAKLLPSNRAVRKRCLATEKLQHGVGIDAVIEVAAMAAQWVDGQPLTESPAQKAKVARAEDQVVGVGHYRDFWAGF